MKKIEIVGAMSQQEQLEEYWEDLTKKERIGNNRYQRNVMFRHAFSVAAREASRLSLQQLGKVIGRDHATVLHACKNHESNMKFSSIYRQAYTHIASTLSDMLLADLNFEEYYGLRDENKKLRNRLMEMSKRSRELISSKVAADQRALGAEAQISSLKAQIQERDVRISALNKKIATIVW